MPFSSMIQEMKGEIGAISRRGLLRSRSQSTGRVQRVEPDEAAMRESSWAQVPPELLRVVLAKVEAGEARWPGRGAVVACAGVCRGWRGTVKEIVPVPEASGKLTFPISLKQPGPRDAPVKCFIRRNRATQSYFLCLGVTDALVDDGKFLLAARKYRRPSCTEYLISLDSKGNGTYLGKLRSNFLGTKFTVYDAHPPCAGAVVSKGPSAHMIGSAQVSPMKGGPPAGNYPVSHISYEVNVLGSRGPRKMNCVMDSIPASAIKEGGTAPTQTEFPSSNSSSFASVPFFRSKSGQLDSSGAQNESKVALKNKSPSWHQQLQCWCLNFHGRVTVASVKNFQLVASGESAPTPSNQEDDDVILQFGKVGKDLFTMDYRYPISAFQAFAICLSSFDTKIGCE
ncbi:hypothetical protein SEVIR_2G435000v4 [Setaria viridis]|uniref:Tubby C-terminal domain-containing protein n=2 Tax=Setaria TaxID=4554 RepID=K3ZU09_SETIT|nr:tubby-like F-box protein 11 [Setaria italica]XP_034579880.1 tubby-like F-box protein 11 [Setaria viridis]RCV14401.1 hypothetical protein SETIT_2G422900v2 [Setaria italica]TKW36356.1 hypothetical protein SEVIR_2G435000v2 [Setaria viridis]